MASLSRVMKILFSVTVNEVLIEIKEQNLFKLNTLLVNSTQHLTLISATVHELEQM